MNIHVPRAILVRDPKYTRTVRKEGGSEAERDGEMEGERE